MPWERGGQGSVVCENVHRAKGLESDTVLLVSETNDIYTPCCTSELAERSPKWSSSAHRHWLVASDSRNSQELWIGPM